MSTTHPYPGRSTRCHESLMRKWLINWVLPAGMDVEGGEEGRGGEVEGGGKGREETRMQRNIGQWFMNWVPV